MHSISIRRLALVIMLAAFCGSHGFLLAQNWKTITVRMLDGKTGKLIATSHFLVRIDHGKEVHANWAEQNENGSSTLSVPQSVSDLTIQATYDNSNEIYVDCDSASQKENPTVHWYSVSAIQTTGVVAPNSCVKPAAAAKLAPASKPGVFVFFVRKRNWKEEYQEDYSLR
jgi:hypothetical protein